jgi:hypothetical protein
LEFGKGIKRADPLHYAAQPHVEPARGRLAQGPPGKVPHCAPGRVRRCRRGPWSRTAADFHARVRHPPPRATRSPLSPRCCGPWRKRSRSPLSFPALLNRVLPLRLLLPPPVSRAASHELLTRAKPPPPHVCEPHHQAGSRCLPRTEAANTVCFLYCGRLSVASPLR